MQTRLNPFILAVSSHEWRKKIHFWKPFAKVESKTCVTPSYKGKTNP